MLKLPHPFFFFIVSLSCPESPSFISRVSWPLVYGRWDAIKMRCAHFMCFVSDKYFWRALCVFGNYYERFFFCSSEQAFQRLWDLVNTLVQDHSVPLSRQEVKSNKQNVKQIKWTLVSFFFFTVCINTHWRGGVTQSPVVSSFAFRINF